MMNNKPQEGVQAGDGLHCLRCHKNWVARENRCPVKCPRCGQKEWWREAGPTGRPRGSYKEDGVGGSEFVEIFSGGEGESEFVAVSVGKVPELTPVDPMVRKKLEAVKEFVPGVSLGMPSGDMKGGGKSVPVVAAPVVEPEPKSLGFVRKIAAMEKGDADEAILAFTLGKPTPSIHSGWYRDRKLHWEFAKWLDKNKHER